MIDVLIRNLNEAFGYGVWVYDKNDATGQIRILHHIGSFEWKDFPIGERLPEPIFSTSTREGDILFDKFIDHNAAEVLKELFPEVFGPRWERFKDETD